MEYYSVIGTDTKIRNALAALRDCQPIIQSKTAFIVRVIESEHPFFSKVTHDLGIKSSYYGENPPPNRKLACGKFYTEPNINSHVSHCKVCRNAAGKPITKPAETIAKVRGLTEMRIENLISAMKLRYEECMDLASEWDRAIKALEGLATLQQRTKELQYEKEEHIKAVRFFMEKP